MIIKVNWSHVCRYIAGIVPVYCRYSTGAGKEHLWSCDLGNLSDASHSSQDENLEPETDEEPVFTGEDLGQVDDTLVDLEPEQIGNIVPVTALVLSITSLHLLLYR